MKMVILTAVKNRIILLGHVIVIMSIWYMYESDNANFYDMGCRARDWHEFSNVSWQTVVVRKARKMVMKSDIVYNTTYKMHIKKFRIFYHKKMA